MNAVVNNKIYDVAIVAEYSFSMLLEAKISPFLSSIDAKPRTLKAYESNVNYFIDWIKDTGIIVKSKNELIEYKNFLKSKVLKATTINAYLTAVRRFFSWLYEENIIKRDFAKNIKSETVERGHKKDPVAEDQFSMMINSLDPSKKIDQRDYLILMLGGTYALRSIEISRLNREDLAVVRGQNVLMIWGKGRNEADKEPFVISADFARNLRSFIGSVEINENAIFTSMSNNGFNSERLSTSGIRYAIKRRFKDVGIPNNGRVSFHSLRHTAITRLHKTDEVNILDLRDFARHKSASTTEIYTHVDKFEDPVILKVTTGRSDMFGSTYTNE